MHGKDRYRRVTLSHHAASVLPTGQIVVPEFRWQQRYDCSEFHFDNAANTTECSNSSESYNGEDFGKYDADDEVDLEISDFDLEKTKKFLRVRRWLNSLSNDEYCMCDSSSSEERAPTKARQLKEYDVVSTGSQTLEDLRSSTDVSNHLVNRTTVDETKSESADDSGFSILHSSIDSLVLGKENSVRGPCSASSESSLNSGELYRTYDVVEMIELQ